VNHYEILEIDRRSSTEEIERAFRKLARKVHPDLNSGDPANAEARMKQLNEIRATLTDPLQRARYDAELDRATEAAGTVVEPQPTVGAGEAAPPKRRPWTGLLLFGLAALGGTAYLSSSSSPSSSSRGNSPPPGGATELPPPDAAPLLAVPTAARASEPAAAEPPRGRTRNHGRGVVRLGSTVDEVFQTFGAPERIEPGRRTGDATFRYGDLRLEITNGRVTGGDAAAR
jgi:curved DNA-binding protein CbpA